VGQTIVVCGLPGCAAAVFPRSTTRRRARRPKNEWHWDGILRAGWLPALSHLSALTLLAGFALLAQAPAPSTGTSAVQLPLSGRGPQSASVNATQTPLPGITSSVNTLSSTIQVQGSYAGSVPHPPAGNTLSLADALHRGLDYNLGATGMSLAARQARGQVRSARAALMPNLNGNLRENALQNDLAAEGLRVPKIPGLGQLIPTVTPPFNYFDLRATLTQSIADFTALNNYKSAAEIARAQQQSAQDARDLVVLAVAGAYLQVLTAGERVNSARAQLETAKALYKQTDERRQAGLSAQIDSNRSHVQMQMELQRLTTMENDLAKQKINLARLTGLPPNDHFDLSDKIEFSPAPPITEEDALKQAFENRADLKAAESQVRAAERSLAAAKAERYPSLALSADYGAIGENPSNSHGTFTVTGSLRFPIWQGGRTEGDIAQAQAALDQRRAELADMKGKIESDIRTAWLDLQTATGQIDVAKDNQQVSRQTLDLTRQRFEAGITDAVEVVQAQEGVAIADLDYINSIFAHNLAKLTLARAIGHAEEHLQQFLRY
jgi:outer membrane protein TolC